MAKVPNQILAQEFLQNPANVSNLLYIENIDSFAYYSEKEGYYKVYSEEEFNRALYLFLINTSKQSFSPGNIKDISRLISWTVANRIKDLINSQYLALSDQLLNLDTFQFEPFAREKPVFHKLRCKSDQIVWNPQSRFAKFLDEILTNEKKEPDQALKDLTQEAFGYALLNTLEGHATFFLVGEGNNGKSVLLSLLRAMIGPDYSVSESVENLSTNRFTTSTLIGKKINICSEEESEYIKSDRFKALVSGDEITVEFKFGKRLQWKPTVKHFFGSNNMPTFSGFNEGLLRRMKFIPFKNQIDASKRDTKLTETLIEDMGCIIAWAIDGAKRLIKNKFFFTNPDASQATLKEFTLNLSSAVLYLWENFQEDAGGMLYDDELYEMYKLWADKRGKKKQSFYSFTKDISRVLKLKSGFGNRLNSGPPEEYRHLIVRQKVEEEIIF